MGSVGGSALQRVPQGFACLWVSLHVRTYVNAVLYSYLNVYNGSSCWFFLLSLSYHSCFMIMCVPWLRFLELSKETPSAYIAPVEGHAPAEMASWFCRVLWGVWGPDSHKVPVSQDKHGQHHNHLGYPPCTSSLDRHALERLSTTASNNVFGLMHIPDDHP